MSQYDCFAADYPLTFWKKPLCGFSLPKGWETLLSELCFQIEQHIRYLPSFRGESLPEEKKFRVVQVKSKFGGLRFYVNDEDDYIAGLITMAEALSYHICEDCGATAEKYINDDNWTMTLCESCANKRNENTSHSRFTKVSKGDKDG